MLCLNNSGENSFCKEENISAGKVIRIRIELIPFVVSSLNTLKKRAIKPAIIRTNKIKTLIKITLLCMFHTIPHKLGIKIFFADILHIAKKTCLAIDFRIVQ